MKTFLSTVALATFGAFALASAASACEFGNMCGGDYAGGGFYGGYDGVANSTGLGYTYEEGGDNVTRESFTDGIDRVEGLVTSTFDSCGDCADNRVSGSGLVESKRITGTFIMTDGNYIEGASHTAANGHIVGEGGSYRFSTTLSE